MNVNVANYSDQFAIFSEKNFNAKTDTNQFTSIEFSVKVLKALKNERNIRRLVNL